MFPVEPTKYYLKQHIWKISLFSIDPKMNLSTLLQSSLQKVSGMWIFFVSTCTSEWDTGFGFFGLFSLKIGTENVLGL